LAKYVCYKSRVPEKSSLKKPLKTCRLAFCGMQRAFNGLWMPLWNVEEDISDFPLHGTVSQESLTLAGYFVPNPTGYKAGQIFAPES
jgi:hypothetical protein